ncbi:glycoside hydrolase family 2 TIM barrel-domain containing protein [Flavobacterium sp. MAHUQ-51]|uniref:glycoside hydrolase family 2 TIM barrel-domain containing protein n=1 Tax=Flavobacterium sp. GCM10022190 TaxID=3252639 RepID=UPI00361109AC
MFLKKSLQAAFSLFLPFLCVITANAQQTKKVFLSGTDFEHPVQWDFMCTAGNNSQKWSKINVPSNWELQGFGEYTYGRWYKELNQKEPSKEEGFYKHEFQIAASDKGKTIYIVFGAAMTDTEVKINGKSAGPIHQGGFYEFKYDISALLNYGGTNVLEAHVSKHSANNSVNAAERKADWWLFGGIYRPVWLEIMANENIAHVAVDAKMDGTLNANLELQNISQKSSITATLTAIGSTTILGSFSFDVNAKEEQKAITMQFPNVKPWSPETPNLYNLKLTLNQNGKTIHEVTERIGFRTLEFIKKDGIYVNGKKIIMKGVNRHEIWPESGRSTSKRLSIMDVNLLKDMNMNAVRGHYPADSHFLQVCDSLGIFVLDELAGWQNSYDTETGSKLVKEMVTRDVNHPSVIIWDNGNEGGWNYKVDSIFADLDPQKRIVIHPWADFNGWDAHHYPAFQTGIHRFVNGENVFFPTEFMHATYDNGGGAGLEDFWNHFKESPLFAGGFIWVFCDEAVKRVDWTGKEQFDSKGSLAADGILGPHREKEGSFFAIKEIWSPIQFAPVSITSKFDGSFFITNDYIFSDLNSCTMEYKVIKGHKEAFYGNGSNIILDQGKIAIPSIEPGATSKIKMPLATNFFEGDWVEIIARDQHGREIYTWSWTIHKGDYFAEKFLLKKESKSKVSIKDEAALVSLISKDVQVSIDKKTGKIITVNNKNGIVPLTNGPTPIGMKAEVKNVETTIENNTAVCTVNYIGGIKKIKWTLTADGRLKMEMLALKDAGANNGFDGAFFQDKVDAFGITFDFPEEGVESMKWLGKGPYHVWKNRIKGTTYGIWDKEYNQTIPGESFENMVLPEFKGYHANLYAASLKAKGNNSFKMFAASENVFLRLFTPDLPKNAFEGAYPQPAFPEGNISFMYEIPAMRDFKPIEHHGPHSQPASIRIKSGDDGIQMNIWFDFRTEK